MRHRYGQIRRIFVIILVAGVYFIALSGNGIFASTPSPANQVSGGEKRFSDFKQRLEKRIDKRIATIEGWMPTEDDDPSRALIIGVREPMTERLKETKRQHINKLTEKKSEIQKALKDEASIDSYVNKHFEAANVELMEHFDESRAKLAALLSPKPLSRFWIGTIGVIFLVAFIFLLGGVFWMIKKAYQTDEEEPPQPARLVKGTVRSIIALSVTYLIFLLALTNFFLNQRMGGYLTAAFASVIAFYFGNRAIEAFYSRKSGFSYSKTLPDGTKEKIEGYEAPDAAQRVEKLTSLLHTTIGQIGQAVHELQRREEQGLGFMRGTIVFDPDKDDKSGVKLTLVEQPEVSTKSAANGTYLLTNVHPGSYTLKAEHEDYSPATQAVDLPPGGNIKVPQILLKKAEKPSGRATLTS